MGDAGWNCIGWPKEHGGRGASLLEEVVFNEEYVRAGGPGRIGHIGETLLGPTLIHFGSAAQRGMRSEILGAEVRLHLHDPAGQAAPVQNAHEIQAQQILRDLERRSCVERAGQLGAGMMHSRRLAAPPRSKCPLLTSRCSRSTSS